jgi:ornithine carbamoyltransferase
MKHFVDILDFSPEELIHILLRAAELKRRMKRGVADRLMLGKTLGMYFEKPSLRTRVSLEAAMATMGGSSICLEMAAVDKREALEDQARVMSRYVDVITMRTFRHDTIVTFSQWATVPVINTLSDQSHPTQALADILTMQEHLGGDLRGKTLAFVGDGNNVARSLAALCAKLGIRFTLAAPAGYRLSDALVQQICTACPDAVLTQTEDPAAAVRKADAVYTDVWASMGQEEEAEARAAIFRPFQVNAALMQKAPAQAIVLHCLPAHRNQEITDEVIESPTSAVFDQAENRMHINRALFAVFVAEREAPERR